MLDLAGAYFTDTNTHWVALMAILDVNRGQTIPLAPSASSCRETILLDAAHAGQWSGPVASFVWPLISDMTIQPDVLADLSKRLMNSIHSE